MTPEERAREYRQRHSSFVDDHGEAAFKHGYQDGQGEAVTEIARAVGLKDQTSPCKGCGVLVYWFRTEKNKRTPIEAKTGLSHWGTCPKAGDFKT